MAENNDKLDPNMPEPETEQPADVAEIEVIEYGNA